MRTQAASSAGRRGPSGQRGSGEKNLAPQLAKRNLEPRLPGWRRRQKRDLQVEALAQRFARLGGLGNPRYPPALTSLARITLLLELSYDHLKRRQSLLNVNGELCSSIDTLRRLAETQAGLLRALRMMPTSVLPGQPDDREIESAFERMENMKRARDGSREAKQLKDKVHNLRKNVSDETYGNKSDGELRGEGRDARDRMTGCEREFTDRLQDRSGADTAYGAMDYSALKTTSFAHAIAPGDDKALRTDFAPASDGTAPERPKPAPAANPAPSL